MRQKLAAWGKKFLGAILVLFVLTVISVVGFVALIIFEVAVTLLLGPPWVGPSLLALGGLCFLIVYTSIAGIFLRYCPETITIRERGRWLLNFYGECWRRGFTQKKVRRTYLVLILTGVGIFVGGFLTQSSFKDIGVVASGLFVPTLMVTTYLQPVVGLPPRAEEKEEKGEDEDKSEGS